jgi:gamma-glutamylaminecyclotransferase|tara:strand:+ start:2542 stop:3633 length:1092 start_codon:yes stop_codon:yes gene_type:complete
MCIIIIKQKGNVMSREIAKTSSKINPHGLGIVWLDTFEVTYHESKEYQQLLTTRPFIAHFRYATVGKVGLSNTHPFVCGKNKDELLMQNGTIRGIGTDEMCDSKVLAISLGNIKRQDWKRELEQYDSRFCSVNLRTRSFQIYNRNLYTYRDGVWYSKTNVLQDNLVAVYGTLKKGFGNYNAYLTNSKHLGSGVTNEKYPLVVDGLPYLLPQAGVGHNVKVDVFKVSDVTFKKLDQLEGHPRWYKRKQIEINMDGKPNLTCWVYFNPKVVDPRTEFVQSFEYSPYQMQQTVGDVQDDCTTETDEAPLINHYQYDFGWDDNDFPTNDTPTCIDCYNDVEHDGFSNYYCSSCGGWFKEDEVLKYQE